MPDSVLEFYEQLAADYHLIFADWDQSIERQAHALDRLIRAQGIAAPCDLLDCSCGIGTQAIGLARRGYTVHATDLSPAAAARAAHEAAARNVTIRVGVADFRSLAAQVPGTFDVVLTCDNALPHLLSGTDLRQAAYNMREKLREGGLLLASIRDYDQLVQERPRATLPQVFDGPDGRRIVFQVWDWDADGQNYRLIMFILRPEGEGWTTAHHATHYRAWQRAEVGAALADAGLLDVRWHMPQDTGYYQPVVTARR